jgi:prolyl oligopeptidase
MRPITGLLAYSLMLASPQPKPPQTDKVPVRETLHGIALTDEYRWLEDQQSPSTRKWIEAQHGHTRKVLDGIAGRSALRTRLEDLIRIERVSPPAARQGRYFLLKRGAREEQFAIFMRQGLNSVDQLLVDPKSLSKDHTSSVTIDGISKDGSLLAYGIQQGGKDERTVKLLQVSTREHLRDKLPEGKWSDISFTPDKKRFFYSTYGGKNPRVKEHILGTPVSADREIFGQGYGETHIPVCEVSHDGRFLLITVYVGSSGDVTELWVKDLERDTPPRPINKGVQAAFLGEIYQGRLYVATNWKAPNWRVLAMSLAQGPEAKWTEVVGESTAVLDSVRVAGGRLVLHYLENVQSRLSVYSLDGRRERDVALPAAGVVKGMVTDPASSESFFLFMSMHIPQQIYRLDTATGATSLWYRLNVPIETGNFVVKQVWYRSKDGTRVPMFLLHRKDLVQDGNNPVLVTGYGGFNVSLTPDFSATAVAWAERGGVYAIANLRGGGEFGEAWHKAGMLANKQNVFDDFYAALEFLVAEKYTRPGRLAVHGTSNGGLLVGALLTQRPELVQAVYCGFPLLDMVRYHQFLVAKFWVPEYGSSDDAQQFSYLLKYSPYHHVKAGTKYPAVMIKSGDFDTRVDPLHARKMAARLQAASGGDRPILLHYDVKAGHAGGLSATQSIDTTVDMLSFLFWQLGVSLR